MEMIAEVPATARAAAARHRHTAGAGHGEGSPGRTASGSEFLTFRLGAEEYGIDILRVQEIRSYEPPTRIANAPAFIKEIGRAHV